MTIQPAIIINHCMPYCWLLSPILNHLPLLTSLLAIPILPFLSTVVRTAVSRLFAVGLSCGSNPTVELHLRDQKGLRGHFEAPCEEKHELLIIVMAISDLEQGWGVTVLL